MLGALPLRRVRAPVALLGALARRTEFRRRGAGLTCFAPYKKMPGGRVSRLGRKGEPTRGTKILVRVRVVERGICFVVSTVLAKGSWPRFLPRSFCVSARDAARVWWSFNTTIAQARIAYNSSVCMRSIVSLVVQPSAEQAF